MFSSLLLCVVILLIFILFLTSGISVVNELIVVLNITSCLVLYLVLICWDYNDVIFILLFILSSLWIWTITF